MVYLRSPGFAVPDGETALTSRLGVTFDDGREVTIIAGIAPSGANTVTFTGVGVKTTTAFVTDGRLTHGGRLHQSQPLEWFKHSMTTATHCSRWSRSPLTACQPPSKLAELGS